MVHSLQHLVLDHRIGSAREDRVRFEAFIGPTRRTDGLASRSV